jgi:hypothetical protein
MPEDQHFAHPKNASQGFDEALYLSEQMQKAFQGDKTIVPSAQKEINQMSREERIRVFYSWQDSDQSLAQIPGFEKIYSPKGEICESVPKVKFSFDSKGEVKAIQFSDRCTIHPVDKVDLQLAPAAASLHVLDAQTRLENRKDLAPDDKDGSTAMNTPVKEWFHQLNPKSIWGDLKKLNDPEAERMNPGHVSYVAVDEVAGLAMLAYSPVKLAVNVAELPVDAVAGVVEPQMRERFRKNSYKSVEALTYFEGSFISMAYGAHKLIAGY